MGDVLKIAAGELGTTESPAGSNRTKYGRWMSLDGQPWCMSFVQWCFAQAGTPLPYRTGSCSALLDWFRKHRPEAVFVSGPQPGDVAIFTFGHTGIVEKALPGAVLCIEGNTSPGAAGSQDNGGGVYRRQRNLCLVRAFIRPYEKKEEYMDQTQFNQMFKTAMDAYRKELRDNDCGQWSREAREWAVASGLFAGSGTAPDGTPNYMWEDLLTREQVAQLFYRFAHAYGMT